MNSLEVKNIIVVCTSALMIFTHTEFRIILRDVTGDPKKGYLERSFFGSYDKSPQKRIKSYLEPSLR